MSLQSAAPTSDPSKNPAEPVAPGALDYLPTEETRLVRGGDILAPGFAMTVAAWLTAYISRMPLVNAPGQVTIFAMLSMVFLGGIFAAQYSRKGLLAALGAGAVSGLLDILIVGSVFHDMNKDATAPAAILWIGGSILLNALVAGLGGSLGMLFPRPRRQTIRWTQVFAIVLAVATLPLITAGGLVTAFHAGLAVPDWPQSYGYNMFLFPLSKMQSAQGNFYEHAHRLLGSLVGLTSLTVAIYTTLAERRGWIKGFAWAIFLAVCIQGVLGGTRVTEKSVALAIIHGIFAQLVFASMAGLAAVTGNVFQSLPRISRGSASTDRVFTSVLLLSLLIQLLLGALVRHTDSLVFLHISMATFVTILVIACGFRAWGLYGELSPLRRTGIAMMLLVLLQLLLGILALVFRSGPQGTPTVEGAFLTTAHQANGALLLATSAVLWVWTRRLLIPAAQADDLPAAAIPAA